MIQNDIRKILMGAVALDDFSSDAQPLFNVFFNSANTRCFLLFRLLRWNNKKAYINQTAWFYAAFLSFCFEIVKLSTLFQFKEMKTDPA